MGEMLESLSDIIITSSQSPSAIMNSKCLQLELPNQTVVGQVSSKDLEVSLFQVMKIVYDKHKLIFVEKLHFPEEHIFCLCNRIVHHATEN